MTALAGAIEGLRKSAAELKADLDSAEKDYQRASRETSMALDRLNTNRDALDSVCTALEDMGWPATDEAGPCFKRRKRTVPVPVEEVAE